MKDSLILEGKIYISARRAAKIINYAQDYVGQLCRTGKLECKMVGRSWFVTEESLLAHRENALESTQERVLKIIKNNDLETKLTIQEHKQSQPIAENKNQFKYQAERSSLLPELNKKVPASFALSKNVFPKNVLALPSRRITSYNPLALVLIVAFISVGSLIFSNSFSYLNNGKSRSSGQASVASVMSGIVDKIMESLGLGLQKNPSETMATNISTKTIPASTSNNASTSLTSNFNGVGVLPSSSSQTADEAAKAKIKNSFSDEVTIRPDQSGTAGVITPIFKKNSINDFIYVLVPVKEKQQEKQN